MSEFIYLYRNGERLSPEAMQQQMVKWNDWMKKLGAAGHLKEAGHPLESSGKIVKAKSVVDGPFAEAKDVIGGFSVIEAKNIEHAVELSAGCPILNTGGAVEVRPILKM